MVITFPLKVENFLHRIATTTNDEAVKLYEEQMTKLKARRLEIEATMAKQSESEVDFGTALAVVMKYLENPVNIWAEGDYKQKRTLLGAYFGQKIAYERHVGFGTAVLPNILRVIRQKHADKTSMVEMPGVKPGSKTQSSFNWSQD